nr:DUF1636 domain-containing protein [Sneathiella aquimaris]
MSVVLNVCITCKKSDRISNAEENPIAETATAKPGESLYQALLEKNESENIKILPVKCLSACSNGCTVALAGEGRWSYVYGHMDAETDVEDILKGVAAYHKTDDGLVPWRERPVIFRKQVISRMPPMTGAHSSISEK